MGVMNFHKAADVDGILKFIRPVIAEKINTSKYGISIEVKNQQKQRTTPQNKYLWEVYSHIVEFYEQTGFIPDNLPVRYINKDFIHAYFKSRFDVVSTRNLNTVDFGKYVDSIQLLMVEQTKGEYTPIYPDEPFEATD